MLPEKTLHAIESHVRQCYPQEACGLILADNSFVSLKNLSPTPMDSFQFTLEDYYLYRKYIQYIFHSHTRAKPMFHICTPSLADVEAQKLWGLPFLIAGFDGFFYNQPITIPSTPNNSYIGRPYIFGVSDCAVLLRDFYWHEFNIKIELDLAESLTPRNNWQQAVLNCLTRNNFIAMPIERTTIYKYGDILLTSIYGGYDNHGVIFLENGLVLDQTEISDIVPIETLSCSTIHYYRHLERL